VQVKINFDPDQSFFYLKIIWHCLNHILIYRDLNVLLNIFFLFKITWYAQVA
jgi:hypothetical protein